MLRPRPARPARPATLLAAILLAAGAACGGEGRGPDADTASSADTLSAGGAETPVPAGPTTRRSLQIASLSSREAADALGDSLAGAGWGAFVTEATVDGARRWRVHALPTPDAALARLAEHALRRERRDVLATPGLVPGDAAGGPAVVRVHRVNHGTKGMMRQLRWTLSPDHRALLAVDDPVSVEAEPVSDGFLYATEGAGPAVVQVDSVWDVAPSPDWEWLAYSYAHLSRSGENEQPTAAEWADLARRAGLSVDETRRRAFPASGMAYVSAVAVPALRRIGPGAAAGDRGAERRIDVAAGWRAAWTTSGALAAFGRAPRSVQDDSPSPSYVLVDPATGAVRDSASGGGALARIAWLDELTLDVSVPVAPGRRPLEAGGRTIVSEGGWVRVRRAGEAGPGRIVAPGTALAATASGRFVLALVLDPDAVEYSSPHLAVVYELAP
jgi:hypothetical protein